MSEQSSATSNNSDGDALGERVGTLLGIGLWLGIIWLIGRELGLCTLVGSAVRALF